MARRIRLLTYTSLYPNSVAPAHGIFVENRIRKLVALPEVDTVVVAPVPWFPFKNARFGKYAKFARVPEIEYRQGITVHHPRYLLIPKIGMSVAPFLMALAARKHVKRLIQSGYRFDVIDSHYFYPDGIAATVLGRWFSKPVVITARGTDLNLIPRYKIPRKLIAWAAGKAAALITVCEALEDVLLSMGVPKGKITVLRNGVDLRNFRRPTDRELLREGLGIVRPTMLSVGHLISRKGHDIVIDALAEIPDVDLIIIGTGPEEHSLRAQALRRGLEARISFVGAIPHEEMRNYYGAADVLVLASSREGWPNVVLEAMACGTPVVAARLWGIPEIIRSEDVGLLVENRCAAEFAVACKAQLAKSVERSVVRAYAEKFSWDATTKGQLTVFQSILEGRQRA